MFGFEEAAEAIRVALECRERSERGIYCECAAPDLRGVALMCFACQCRHRGQEVAAVHRIVDAHDFEPSTRFSNAELNAGFCLHCTRGVDDPRHNGVPAIGRTSWGEDVPGVSR